MQDEGVRGRAWKYTGAGVAGTEARDCFRVVEATTVSCCRIGGVEGVPHIRAVVGSIVEDRRAFIDKPVICPVWLVDKLSKCGRKIAIRSEEQTKGRLKQGEILSGWPLDREQTRASRWSARENNWIDGPAITETEIC